MQEVTFTLRVLTPLFLTGAEQTTAELRAPSFRGLMRYWHRALVGGLVGANTPSLERLKEAETALFGATNKGSAVAIKVSASSDKPKEFIEPISVRVGGNWQATGKGYLLWSMARSGKVEKGNLKPARWYFPPGTSFRVTLSTRGTDTTKLDLAISAFWLFTQLGSLGSRARRCAGSLTVQDIQGYHTTLPFEQAESTLELRLQLEQGMKKVRENTQQALAALAQELLQQTPIRQTEFDILAPGVCRIWILQDEQPWSSAEAAMTRIGEDLQQYRREVAPGQRKIFGLPLPPLILNKRRSSPLLLRVAELQGKKYVGIAVLFKTVSSDISLKDYQIIENWINTFRGKQEVML